MNNICSFRHSQKMMGVVFRIAICTRHKTSTKMPKLIQRFSFRTYSTCICTRHRTCTKMPKLIQRFSFRTYSTFAIVFIFFGLILSRQMYSNILEQSRLLLKTEYLHVILVDIPALYRYTYLGIETLLGLVWKSFQRTYTIKIRCEII